MRSIGNLIESGTKIEKCLCIYRSGMESSHTQLLYDSIIIVWCAFFLHCISIGNHSAGKFSANTNENLLLKNWELYGAMPVNKL
jgi:hypothetical protein